ncbi:venom metalloproteinase antarease-like TtrivMP_A [Folsomia candida]|nr:venom metalloproteinase antarease-like TtrivMP_A [Folsomia candida]
MVNGRTISHDNDGVHEIGEISAFVDTNADYVNIPGDAQNWLNQSNLNTRTIGIQTVAVVELVLVIDFSIFTLFNGEIGTITEYYAVFVKGVNNLFATNVDPNITFQLVGIYVLESRDVQPFVENYNNFDGSFDIHGILREFSTYMTTNAANYVAYDSAALMSTENFGSIGGVAWLGGTCSDGWKATINRDRRRTFDGVRILAHEMGHNLGSPHDGDSTSAACPLSDGYIMHTSGGMDENRFKFSECSKDAMRSYIDSEEGSCLFVNNAVGDPLPVPDKNPGDIFSIEMYCVLTYGPDATVKVANDMCASMQCRWPGPCPEPDEAYTCTWSGTNFQPAPDGASCGEADAGTICFLGKCVTLADLPTTTTTLAPLTSTTLRSTTTPIPGFVCEADGIFHYPLNCSQYIRCITIFGKMYSYLYTCPANYIFNPSNSLCSRGVCS